MGDNDEENPIVIRSLELVQAAVRSLLRDEISTEDRSELLKAIHHNVGAMRAILDPSVSTVVRLDMEIVTPRAIVTGFENTARDLRQLSDQIWSEIADADRQEAELEQRRKQRAAERSRLAELAKAKELALAAVVKSDGWMCPTCTLQNRLSARKCEVCSTYRPAEAKPKPVETSTSLGCTLAPAAATEGSSLSSDEEQSGDDRDERAPSPARKRVSASGGRKRGAGAGAGTPTSRSHSRSSAAATTSSSCAAENAGEDGIIMPSSAASSPRSVGRKRAHATVARAAAVQLNANRRPRSDSRDSTTSSTAGGGGGAVESFRSPASKYGLGGGGLWLRDRPNAAMDEDGGQDGEDPAPEEGKEGKVATKLVWCCAMCTLENDMRARVCEACGESRAHAIRGEPSVFLMGDSPRVKRVKVDAANPRRLPLIGSRHQIDPDSLPVPTNSPRLRFEQVLNSEKSADGVQAYEFDPEIAYGQLIWLAPRQAASAANASAENDIDDEKFARIQSFLKVFAANQTLALRELSSCRYDVSVAETNVRAKLLATISANAVADEVGTGTSANDLALNPSVQRQELLRPSWLEDAVLARPLQYAYRSLGMPDYDGSSQPSCIFSSAAVDAFADGVAQFGDSWSNVRKYMSAQGFAASLRQIQDFFYGPWCAPDMRPRARACELAYEAKMKAQEIAERRLQAEETSRRRKVEAERRREERLRELSGGTGGVSDASPSASSPVNTPFEEEIHNGNQDQAALAKGAAPASGSTETARGAETFARDEGEFPA
jgi:hypothetical protein